MSAIPILTYFDLSPFNDIENAGRGGAVKFFLLQHGIQFQEELVGWDDWANGLKTQAIDSGKNISGHLPVLKLNGEDLFESFAIMRYLSKEHGLYGSDAKRDYLVDMAADLGSEWRNAYSAAAFGTNEDKKTYLTGPHKRNHYYKLFDTIITRNKGSGPHLVGNSPSFADTVVFAVLWDDIVAFGNREELMGAHPRLGEFFKAYSRQDAIKGWCEAKKPELMA
eukprot:GHRR01000674.1.p1 GENE.GHRR01000674.1~~GHRR01000674.1.p1  ORF type:complete len:223 (+),score=57.03 GHRR01000674.1:238-906(+)